MVFFVKIWNIEDTSFKHNPVNEIQVFEFLTGTSPKSCGFEKKFV